MKNQRKITKTIGMAILTTILLFAVGVSQAQNTAESDAIIGEWTNSDKDATFEIYKKNNKYYGKILSGSGGDSKDTKNPDESLRDRELVGLTILNNFVFEGEKTWEDGTIYDPNNGKTYSCILTLTSVNELDVRGFVGVSLFGRTEEWTRIN